MARSKRVPKLGSSAGSDGRAAGRRARRGAKPTQLAFEAIAIEGGLLSPDWLARAAQLEAGGQSEADYRIPKGLHLRDEIGRYWRIAQAHWGDFVAGRQASTAEAAARALAERFLTSVLRECFGFSTLAELAPLELDGRTYPVGHAALDGRVPVVVAPAGSGLEALSPAFGDGTRRRSAFGLCQEFLNAADGALWGLASDGVTLRILRDNASLTRPAWIEADLARIFAEERYADFAALWLLAHETRFGRRKQPVTECALEAWREAGRQEGTRAREQLRHGVEEALAALGQGFVAHPDNQALRALLASGALTKEAYFQQLLRLAYRLIFLLTVEERGVLHPDGVPAAARALYADGYTLRRLRERAVKRSAHDRHHDHWEGLKIVLRGLASGEPRLGLPALAGLFAADQCPALDGARLENRFLLLALFRLSWLREPAGLARVNWRDMGPEELGSVYESLLELVPQITEGGRSFTFATGAETKGHARKTSGSYYTPDSLVQVLLDSALDPVLERTIAEHPSDPVQALLSLSIVDPACGSGHFLLAAARRLGAQVARLQANGTPSAAEYRHALRQVVSRCIYGVDLNPMAVELCKVSLWMEAVEPGLPLTFLDSHIRHGNALLGTTPELMDKGIPDNAWQPIEGDDKRVASALKKRNKEAEKGQRGLDALWSQPAVNEADQLRQAVAALETAPDADVAALARKESQWHELLESEAYHHQKLVADAWCAAFVWPKQPGPLADAAPTNELWRQIRDRQGQPPALTVEIVMQLAEQYTFFHWHLAFPQVFARGGFDVVLGNPPWETINPDVKEFFSAFDPDVRALAPGDQEARVAGLTEDPTIREAWNSHATYLYAFSHFIRQSGRYHLFAGGRLGGGDLNAYRMFVETALTIARAGSGYVAQIVPEGIYNGANTSGIRRFLFSACEVVLLLGLQNLERRWFPEVYYRMRFALLVASRRGARGDFSAAFGIVSEKQLDAVRRGTLLVKVPLSIVAEFSPEALAIMEFTNQRDIDIAAKMYAAHPKLGDEAAGPPYREYMCELHMGNDRRLFSDDPDGVPLYEGRMVARYDHRAKGYRAGRGRKADWQDLPFSDPSKSIQPQWFIPPERIPEKVRDRFRRYRVGFCDVASPTNERTLVATFIPPGCVCGHKVPTIAFDQGAGWAGALWLGVANAFATDYLARKKVSLSMSYTVLDSLPFPRLSADDPRARFIVPRVARLVCTGPEMIELWNQLSVEGWVPAHTDAETLPGVTEESERAVIEGELDAYVASAIFGLTRDELAYVLDTFPIVAKRDRKAHGEYRTKRVILEIYDAMADAARTGRPYQTRLDPPPADARGAHPPPHKESP